MNFLKKQKGYGRSSSLRKYFQTRLLTFSTSKNLRNFHGAIKQNSSSTAPLQRPFSRGRSNSAPILSFTQRQNSSISKTWGVLLSILMNFRSEEHTSELQSHV